MFCAERINKQYNNKMLFALILLLSILLLLFTSTTKVHFPLEGFVATVPLPPSKILPSQYYKIDDENMAKIPYGYRREDQVKEDGSEYIIVSVNKELDKAVGVTIPSNNIIPDGFYQLSPTEMAHLPPGMMAKISAIDANGKFTFAHGYVNETQYYAATFPFPKDSAGRTVTVPPAKCYITSDKKKIALLPYGKIADSKKGFGYIDDPKLMNSSESVNQKYESNPDIDVTYHEDPSTFRDAKTEAEDRLSGTAVFDPTTKSIKILPRMSIQSDLFYVEPGKYGSGIFVPDYKSSINLSSSTLLPTNKNYNAPETSGGFCKALAEKPKAIDAICNTVDPFVCANTDCCVLLGGQKCVAGNQFGPALASTYGDKALKNNDFYYYHSKCYGNCPPTSVDGREDKHF